MSESLSRRRTTARRIGSGVAKEGKPQVKEATPSILAARIAISLIADILMPDTVLETGAIVSVILLSFLCACVLCEFMLPASGEQ